MDQEDIFTDANDGGGFAQQLKLGPALRELTGKRHCMPQELTKEVMIELLVEEGMWVFMMLCVTSLDTFEHSLI